MIVRSVAAIRSIAKHVVMSRANIAIMLVMLMVAQVHVRLNGNHQCGVGGVKPAPLALQPRRGSTPAPPRFHYARFASLLNARL